MSGILAALAGIKTAIATAVDEYFNRTTLLLNTSSTNGAQNNTFLDSSTNNFTITRNGNTTQGTFTPFSQTGWSNYFNGSNSYMTLGGAASLALSSGDFEISLWAYWNSVGTQVLYEGRPGSNGAYPAILTSSSVLIYFVNSANAITGPTVVANQWYYITVSRVSGTTKMFVNGSQVGSNYTDGTNYATGGTAPWIGAGYAPGDYMNGYISNLRVVVGSGVTSQTVPTTPLTAITNTKLLTCQSNRFVDSSASPLTITVNGTPSVQAFSPFAPTAAYDAAVVGGSAYFDGSGDYLVTPSDAAFNLSSGDWTIEGWVYLNSNSDDTRLFTVVNSSTDMYGSYVRSGTVYIGKIGFSEVAFSTIRLNSWNHIAFCKTSTSTITCYINGASAGSTTTYTLPNANCTVYVAASPANYALSSTNGYISNFRIVKGTAVYTSTFTPPTAPLTAITNTSLLLSATNSGIYDSTAKNVLETVGNAQVSTTQAKWGTTAIYFDGTGDYLAIPNSPTIAVGSGDFTIEGWWYPTDLSGTTNLWCLGDERSSYNGLLLYWSGGTSKLTLYSNGSAIITSSISTSINTWCFISVVRSGTTITLYVNGSSAGTVTNSTSFTGVAANGFCLNAEYYGSFVAGKAGYYDDFRITKGYARPSTSPTEAFPLQ